MDTSEEKCYVFQPNDIKRFLKITNDNDYDLVIKSWRFLFDFMYAMPDGTVVHSNLVKWIKCRSHEVVAVDSCGNRQLEFNFCPELDEEDLSDEIIGVLKDSKIVKIPTV